MEENQPIHDKYVRFDWAIKRLLRQKANFGVLEGFLTVFLNEKIKIVEILESEGNQQSESDKFNRVDIKARNSKDEIIIIEIQNTRELYYLERILYGVAKAITEHMSIGDRYHKVKKIYSISIIYFDIGVGKDYLYYGQNHFIGFHTHDELQINTKEQDAIVQRYPRDIFPEYILIRVNQFDEVATSPMSEWMDYLKRGVIPAEPKAPGLEEAKEKLMYYAMSHKEQLAYDAHQSAMKIQNDVIDTAKMEGEAEGMAKGLAQGRAEGRAEGLAEGEAKGRAEGLAEGEAKGRAEGEAKGRAEGEAKGRHKANLENARNLKSLGVASSIIAQATGLSVEEIEKL